MDERSTLLLDTPHGSEHQRACTQLSTAGREVVCRHHPESGETLWFGDIGEVLLGHPAGELRPPIRLIGELVHERDRADFAERWSLLMSGDFEELEILFRRADGEPRMVRIHQVPDIHDPDWVILRFRDIHRISQKRHAESEQKRTQAIQSVVGGVAHEFNNHLTPIRGFVELAMDDMDRDSEVLADLELVLAKVEQCGDLLDHIQSYSGKMILDRRPTDLGKVTDCLVHDYFDKCPGRIVLEESQEPGIPLVDIDHPTYKRALQHLLDNALTAMPDRGTLRVRTEVVPDAPVLRPNPAGYVRVSMSDSGCGISPETLKRVRDPFFTTHGRATARGLGLAMVHGTMQQHGGCLELVSSLGRGTTASLYFPLPEPPIQEDDTLFVLPAAEVGRMLVADDEEVIRQLVSRVFKKEGWIIEEAQDFNETLRSVEKDPGRFDLILLDLTMPGPSAEGVIEQLREMECDAGIMMVTGMPMDDRLQSLIDGCDGHYVPKPFSPISLVTEVDAFLSDLQP